MIEQRSLSEKNAPVNKTVLANGLTIITEKMAHLRSVSVGIWVRSETLAHGFIVIPIVG